MSFQKWQRTLGGSSKIPEVYNEQVIRAKLREFARYVEMSDYSCLNQLILNRDDCSSTCLEDFAYWGAVPKPFSSLFSQTCEACQEADELGEIYSLNLPTLVWWYLEELHDLAREQEEYDESYEGSEYWVDYTEEEQEAYGETGYWAEEEYQSVFDTHNWPHWQHEWGIFFDTLPEELREPFESL